MPPEGPAVRGHGPLGRWLPAVPGLCNLFRVHGTGFAPVPQEGAAVACCVVDAPFQDDSPGLVLDDLPVTVSRVPSASAERVPLRTRIFASESEFCCPRCGSWSAVCGPGFCGRGG